jgi:hypothetical protein
VPRKQHGAHGHPALEVAIRVTRAATERSSDARALALATPVENLVPDELPPEPANPVDPDREGRAVCYSVDQRCQNRGEEVAVHELEDERWASR